MIHLTVEGKDIVLYKPIDAQFYLNVSQGTLARWRREGWLEPVGEVGNCFLYTQAALDEALSARNKDRETKEVSYA